MGEIGVYTGILAWGGGEARVVALVGLGEGFFALKKDSGAGTASEEGQHQV